MKKVIAEFLVDEERLVDMYTEVHDIDDFSDALNSEFGVMEEYGIKCMDWKVKKEESYNE